jgi:hypothetical protein
LSACLEGAAGRELQQAHLPRLEVVEGEVGIMGSNFPLPRVLIW